MLARRVAKGQTWAAGRMCSRPRPGGENVSASRWARDAEEQETANRQTASLAGVAVTLLLLVLGLFLVRALNDQSAMGTA